MAFFFSNSCLKKLFYLKNTWNIKSKYGQILINEEWKHPLISILYSCITSACEMWTVEEENEAFAAILYAEPGALGLIANIMAALVVAIENIFDERESSVALILTGVHLIIIGGFLQLLAGFMSYRRNDHLTGSTFIVFSSLWTIQGINHILMTKLPFSTVQYGVLPGIIGFMAIAVILSICAATVNYIMPPVLIAIMIALVFEGVGLFFLWGRQVAAVFEIIIALSGIYGVVVMTLKGASQRYILPGFGNAPYDVLLIRTKSPQSKENEKKKNTKYAEPMGMGYLGNVVPAVIMAFHHFGYISDFCPAIPMFLSSLFCHVSASYYAFLRHDFFNAIQFIIYAVFWISKALNELFISLNNVPAIDDSRINFYGQWSLLVVMFVLLICSLCQSRVIYFYNLLFTLMVILSVDHIPRPVYNFTFGVPCCFIAFFSLFMATIHLINSIAEKTIMYVGQEPYDMEKLRNGFERMTACVRNVGAKVKYTEEGPHVDDEIVETLCFLSSGLACICLSPLEVTQGTESLPWLLVAGAALQLYVARCAYASGSLAKTYMSTVYALYWMTWSALLFNNSFAIFLRSAAIALLVLHTMGIFLTFTFTKIWIPFTIFFELNMIAFLLRCFGVQPTWMVLVTALLAGMIALYGSFAGMINGTLQGHLVPLGTPLLTEKQPTMDAMKKRCPTFTSKRTSAILKAAKIIDQGGIVGVPTDTVYALAASCKIPASIKNIYHVKERPAEKPICICLSNLDQLANAKPDFSDLLWAFMQRCYPGGISCVVPKGEWMINLGLGEAIDYIGNKNSVCIRVPDSSVLAYLVSLTGPVALSSANPSGGADSIHHDMVLDSLGHKIDGMVCDGESRERAPSTVVNCLNIDQGEISFFRIGCTPQEYVENLFKEAQAEVGWLLLDVALDERPNKDMRF